MIEAIGMPDLDLFMPGLFNLSFCCGRQELKHRVVISRSFVPASLSPNRRLKKPASSSLASFRPSTYPDEYALYLGVVVHETDGP